MFQLEILHAKILDMNILEKLGVNEKVTADNVAIYIVSCRTEVGKVPIRAPVVWVYGAGRSSVKASLSHMFISYDFERTSYDALVRLRGLSHYLLEVPRGAEIAAGMLISDVPADAAPGQAGE